MKSEVETEFLQPCQSDLNWQQLSKAVSGECDSHDSNTVLKDEKDTMDHQKSLSDFEAKLLRADPDGKDQSQAKSCV